MEKREQANNSTYHDQIIGRVEELATECELDHRFLGGLPSLALSAETCLLINADQRTAQVFGSPVRSLVRPNGTIKDLDAIYFNPDQTAYKEFLKLKESERKKARRQGRDYPIISFERARWPGDYPNRWLQFVSSVEIGSAVDTLVLAYGQTRQTVPKSTFDRWKLVFDGDLTISTIHPAAIPERYLMRTGSGNIKPKDQEKYKIMKRQAADVIEEYRKQGFDYEHDFETWTQFIDKLRHHPDRLTRIKGLSVDIYWNTIGTWASQTVGAKLGNKMTG